MGRATDVSIAATHPRLTLALNTREELMYVRLKSGLGQEEGKGQEKGRRWILRSTVRGEWGGEVRLGERGEGVGVEVN